MGVCGRMFGGLGDWIEDELFGNANEHSDENFVTRKIRKIKKYIGVDKFPNVPGMPGPIVLREDLTSDHSRGRSVFETIFNDPIKRIPVGSIVCCDLAFAVDHTGIYVGRGRIIHRDGDGFLASVTPEVFLDRLNGVNNAINIFVACDERGHPVGGEDVAKEARLALKTPEVKNGYNLFLKNCHQFCRYCITGEEGNIGNFTFTSLEDLMKREFGFARWRVWKFD